MNNTKGMKFHLCFSSRLQDSSIKCLNRADFGDRMKHLKITKKSSRNNIYLELNLTKDAFICQNKVIRFDDLCIDKSLFGFECETESKALIDL